MTDTAEPIEDAEWLSAAEALRRVEAVMSEGRARLAICTRAHDALIRTHAERFIKDRQIFEDIDLPTAFWWAEGHEALEQNWVSGDFSTWVNERSQWKAYGVRFLERDIAKLLPQNPPRVGTEQSQFIASAEALRRVRSACADEQTAASLLLAWIKAGELVARARALRKTHEGRLVIDEHDKVLAAEDWEIFDAVEPLAFRSGIATATGWDSEARESVTVRMTGLHLHKMQLVELIQSMPTQDSDQDIEGEWVFAREAVYRIMAATQMDATRSLYSIVAYAKTGAIRARTLVLCIVTHRQGFSPDKREERNVAVPLWFWEDFTSYGSSAFNWQSGVFEGNGFRDGKQTTVTLTGVQFDARGLDILDPPSRPTKGDSPAAAATKGGRPTAAWWEDLILDTFAKIHFGDLKPERQSQIEAAMNDWIVAKGLSASLSTVRKRARKLWEA